MIPALLKFIQQELRLYARGLDAAQKAAGKVVVFLTQRYLVCLISLLSKVDSLLVELERAKLQSRATKRNIELSSTPSSLTS